jgi:beta-glucanase (GH16 family)
MKVSLAVTATVAMLGICLANEPSGKPSGCPSNPLKKAGWTLVVNDEFDGPKLNDKLWIPEYFPDRFKTPARAFYYFKDGAIHLSASDPAAKRFGKYQSVSSLQTFNCHNLHKKYASKPEDVQTTNKFTQLYGWYEIRAKHVGPMHHVAFWMLEAKIGGSEIDVIEGPAWPVPNWHKWASPHAFPNKRERVSSYDKITTKKQRATAFHLYALEVFPEGARIYHDNQLIEEAEIDWKKRGETPLMFFLGIYGSQSEEHFNQKQEYVVDYFREYRINKQKTPQNKTIDSDKL